ncbi:hypothetical protein [Streptococcus oricebi]|uniref:Uncharacterized protein n=1 Tax=Streptococcus oricebi TaxID=1547447 RepID=A0ABS5B516_9STRE|nr:hypothetical protein [Streptococcus oricebi]MBP2623840.1 hypothetical protein [Streptococcus oricebi]
MYYAVYHGKEFQIWRQPGGKTFRLSTSNKNLAEGDFKYDDYTKRYDKILTKEELSYLDEYFELTFLARYQGRIFQLASQSDEKLDKEDSWVRLYTDDLGFMKEYNLAEDSDVVEHTYGHVYYATAKIPVSKLEIIRERKNLPINSTV